MGRHNREVRQLVADALAAGWHVHRETRSGWLLAHPDHAQLVSVHRTPSDHRATANTRSQLGL